MKKITLIIALTIMLSACSDGKVESERGNISDIKDEMVSEGIDPNSYYIHSVTDNSYTIVDKRGNTKYLVTIEYEQVESLNMSKVDKIIDIKKYK